MFYDLLKVERTEFGVSSLQIEDRLGNQEWLYSNEEFAPLWHRWDAAQKLKSDYAYRKAYLDACDKFGVNDGMPKEPENPEPSVQSEPINKVPVNSVAESDGPLE